MLKKKKNSSPSKVSSIFKKKILDTSLINCIHVTLKNYFLIVMKKKEKNLYKLFLSEIEKPLLDSVMQHTRGNQTKAAIILGISRGTLRKKLSLYYSTKL